MIVLFGKGYASPPPAPLPEFRVTESFPFASAGCNFAGPLYCKHSRNAPEEKFIFVFSRVVVHLVTSQLTVFSEHFADLRYDVACL